MARYTSTLSTLNEGDNQSLQSAVVTQQQSIIGLQNQIDNIQTEVTGLNSGIQNIGGLIQRDSILEQTRLLEEQKREKLLTERNIRIGKENEIEQRLTQSLSSPLQRLEPRLTSTFSRIASSLQFLLFGFLGKGLIEGISSIAKFSIKGFDNVRKFVSRALSFVGNGVLTLRTGFNGVINAIGGIVKKISGIALNLARSPIKYISELFKNIPGLLSGGVKNVTSAAGNALGNVLKIGSKALPPVVAGGALTAIDVASGEKDLSRSVFGVGAGMIGSSAAFTAGSFLPVPGSGLIAGSLAYKPAEEFGKNVYDYTTTNFRPQSFFSNLNLNFDAGKLLGGMGNLFGKEPTSPKEQKVMGDFLSKGPTSPKVQGTIEDNLKVTPPPSPAQVQTPPVVPPPVGKLSEPAPDVVVASTLSKNQPESQGSVRSGPITDVPLLPSANIDNFYTLYSQTQYNVVM